MHVNIGVMSSCLSAARETMDGQPLVSQSRLSLLENR